MQHPLSGVLLSLEHESKGVKASFLKIMLVSTLLLLGICSPAPAQQAPNQTQGFGNGRVVTFTYLQNFDCVDQPTLDLDFNKIPAQSDPAEMQTPICQVVTETSADPTGGPLMQTAHLYVLVPMFGTSTNASD